MKLKDRIRSIIMSKTVASEHRTIGIEEECIIYDEQNHRLPVNQGNKFSATDLLNIMNSKSKKNGLYSIEPGGQLEWSSPPFSNIHDINSSMITHKSILNKVINEKKLRILNYSVEPVFEPKEIELIDHLKYQLMDKNMAKVDTLGRWMMRNTASIQINYDFESESELEEMVFIADCLQPVSSYLFSNAPFWRNKVALNENIRYLIWENTDKYRCRNLIDHGILEPKGLVNKYIDYILNVPGIFGFDDSGEICSVVGTLGEWLEYLKKNNLLRDLDINGALHQIFTNVRLKNLIEVRGADRPPFGYELAPVAFWTGLLTVSEIREKVMCTIINWNIEERLNWNSAARYLDDSIIGPKGESYYFWNKWAGDLALEGLERRGLGEETYFCDYFDIVLSDGPFSLQKQKDLEKKNKTILETVIA